MTTPADWYPDPEVPDQLRYWDGASWTEHRAPAPTRAPIEPVGSVAADEISESGQATPGGWSPEDSASSAEPGAPGVSGAHRAADAGTGAAVPSYEPPATPQSETRPFTPPPLPSWDPPPGQSVEPTSGPTWDAPPSGPTYPPSSSWDAPPGDQPSSFAPPPHSLGPPPSGSSEGPNKKLVIGILGGAAALILALVLAFVYVLVIRDDDTAVVASPSSTSKSTTTSKTTSTTESTTSKPTATEPSNAGPVTDGNLSFTITDVEAAESVTSSFSDAVGKTAQGTYAVVHLKVGNSGTDPVTFLATFQRLNGSGQSLAPDDEATVFAGGGYADVAPGAEVDTIVVFDVPDDVEPTSMFFQESPVTPGVELTF